MEGLVRGFGDVVVTPHHHSTQAAMGILAADGNAIDAAIAANAVQGVVAPETCGIGGDLFALIHAPGMVRPAALNASGWAGAGGFEADRLLAEEGEMPLFGPHSVTIPGCVAGWAALAETHGRLPLERLLEPARRLARDGIVVTEELAGALDRRGAAITGGAADELVPDGRPPSVGERVRRPSLATTLDEIAEHGSGAFYTGRVAEAIAEAVGGLLTVDDIADYRPAWVEPIGLDVAGMTGWTIPPNSQGYLTLAALGVLERLDAADDPATNVHREVEAYRAFAWERDDVVADPAHAPISPATLLDPDRISARAELVDDRRASTWPGGRLVPGGTAYLCVVDADGLGVSLIQSNFHGLGTTLSAAGFLLHNRGGGFTLTPEHPNRLGAGKRPLHTLSPTIWTDGDRLRAVLGTRGGHQQPQLLMQMARRLWADGLAPDAAQAAPRWTTNELGPDAPSTVVLERGLAEQVGDGLAARGHDVEVADERMGGWGPISVIAIDDDGLRSAAPDPRVRVSSAAVR